MAIMFPVCTFEKCCVFKYRNKKCKILTDMPKPRDGGECPFRKIIHEKENKDYDY